MPQVTVYIRNEDLGKWKLLEKKSEFIHQALNEESHPLLTVTEKDYRKANETVDETLTGPKVKTPKKNIDKLLAIPEVKRASEANCPKHHVPRSVCRWKH